MRENGIISRILGSFFSILIILGLIWGEIAGIYHSFKNHGVSEGMIACIIPPYSWYRSIDFIFWIARGGLSQTEKKEIAQFVDSIQLGNKALILFKRETSSNVIGTIDEDKISEVFDLLQKSLDESQNVRNKVLSKLHRELPSHYRNEFCEGVKVFIKGWEESSPEFILRGQILMDTWGIWYNEHFEELKAKYSGKKKKFNLSIKSDASEIIDLEQITWPELSVEELERFTVIIGKALQQPLETRDIEQLKEVISDYQNRVGRSMTNQDVEIFTKITEIIFKYDYELGRCLLQSFDSKEAFISRELKEYQVLMEILGHTRKSKLDNDLRKIESVVSKEAWTDEFGQIHTPLTREDIIAGLKDAEIMKKNFDKIAKAYEDLTNK